MSPRKIRSTGVALLADRTVLNSPVSLLNMAIPEEEFNRFACSQYVLIYSPDGTNVWFKNNGV